MPKACSVEDCEKTSHAGGMCRIHYGRFLRSGNPAGTRSMRGAAQKYINEVVMPYGGDECLIWPFIINNGYGRVSADGEMRYAHVIVCERENGPAPTPLHQAAHSCGKGKQGCVTKSHLSWKTRSENEADKLGHGTDNRGAKHPMAKLSENDVRQIISLKGSASQSVIAAQYGVTRGAVKQIHSGKTWGWLE